MSKLGKALVVKEEEMNAITAVIGSGVAYSLMFIEALAEEGPCSASYMTSYEDALDDPTRLLTFTMHTNLV